MPYIVTDADPYGLKRSLPDPTGDPKTEWWHVKSGRTHIDEYGQLVDSGSGRTLAVSTTPFRYPDTTNGSADGYYRKHCGSFTRHRRGECSHGD